MLHRKTLLLLMISGSLCIKSGEYGVPKAVSGKSPEGYVGTVSPREDIGFMSRSELPRVSYAQQYESPTEGTYREIAREGTYTVQEREKPAATRKEVLVQKLKDAEKSGDLCPIAARLGRGLRALPKTAGKFNRKWLFDKCGDYFLDNNHPQAYAAVTSYPSMKKEAVEEHARKARAGK